MIQFKEKQKLTFKFVVNGSDWVVNPNYKSEWDDGNENNVVDESELTLVEPFTEEEQVITAAKDVAPEEEHQEAETLESHHDLADEEDFDTSPHTDKDIELSQVSSYSAVSIPASVLEFVTVTPAATEEAVVLEDSVDGDEFEDNATPMLSLSNSRVATGAPATPTSPGGEGSYNIETPPQSHEGGSILNSINGNSGKSHSALKPVDILKAPGAFPSSPTSLVGTDATTPTKASTKRDGLMGRFRSLFRY